MNPFLIALIVVGSILIYVFTIYLADALLVKYDFERDATTRGLLAWFWPIYRVYRYPLCPLLLRAVCASPLPIPGPPEPRSEDSQLILAVLGLALGLFIACRKPPVSRPYRPQVGGPFDCTELVRYAWKASGGSTKST